MFKVNSMNSRTWSRIGVRATYGIVLYELAMNHPEIIALSADLGRSSGLKQLMDKLPQQYVNVGIAEQNMIGVAAGLAREGFKVFASSFAPFISMRASEHIRMSLGYMQYPVKLVALGSGVSMGFLGNSHYGLEDMAVMQSIPGMTVVSPADCVELYKLLTASLNYEYPVYIRLTAGVNAPIVYNEDYEFSIGKAVEIRAGSDLCIIAIGSMVATALTLSKKLEIEYGISSAVVNLHTLKPVDDEYLRCVFSKFSILITIEEHNIIGGLASTVSQIKAKYHFSSRLLSFGINDKFLNAGDYEYVLSEAGLTTEKILWEIVAALELKRVAACLV